MTDQNMSALPANEAADEAAMRDWAERLVAQARREGVELTGDGGLLTGLVRQVLQTGLEVEMAEHLGYERHAPEGRGTPKLRNVRRPSDSRPTSARSTCVCRGIGRALSSR